MHRLYAWLISISQNLFSIFQFPARVRHAVTRHSYVSACALGTVGLMLISVVALYVDAGLGFYVVEPVLSDLTLIEGTNVSLPGIGFALQIAYIDVGSSSFSISWWPVGCNQSNELPRPQWITDSPSASASLTDMGCDRTPDSYDLWVDLRSYWSWNATMDLVRSSRPNKRGRLLISNIDTFNTSHPFSVTSPVETASQRRQFSLSAWYPFDRYTGTVVLEAFDSATKAPLPIYFAHLYGGATGFYVSTDAELVTTSRTSTALMLTFSIRRATAVRLFAIALSVTNYFLAIGMVWIAVAAGKGLRLPDSVLILPLTNILALPQLRAAMPDVPDFGIFLDIFCYEVNLLAVVFSAMFIMTRILATRWLHIAPIARGGHVV
ncbi:hypothetical protein C8Q74DRAFT_1218587 [Fomes fomentarius]|nr:hypothetical protein C8Q74DRAFT_1218587 [Fomes fomentarius]